jgi:two-component system sensor kinase FixL
MNWVVFVWAFSVGACAVLGFTHFFIWLRNRTARAELFFALAAGSVGAIAVGELQAMLAKSPGEFAAAVRWIHVPLLVLVSSLVGFVHRYFGTGRQWLGAGAVGFRLLAFVLNFLSPINLHFRELNSLRQVRLFGEAVSAAGDAVINPWNRIAEVSSLFLLAYVIDASITLWRKGGERERSRAMIVGGTLSLFILFVTSHGALIHLRIIEFPYLLSFSFLAILLVMAYQLSGDAVKATRLTSALQESQEQVRLAASAAGLILWNWKIPENRIWVTDEVKNLYGVDPDEVVTVERFLGTVHPDDRPGLEKAMEASLAGLGEFAREYRVVLPDGRVRWISARGRVEPAPGDAPLRMRGVSIDMTEKHLAEERAQRLLEAAPWGILLVDASMRIHASNGRADTLFGYDPGQLVGLDLGGLLPGRFRERHRALFDNYLRDPSTRPMGAGRELSGLRRDGSEFPIEVALAPLELENGRHVLASVSDVTERRLAEHEAAKHREVLAHLSRVNSLGLLSASLAHELNQPLAIILSNAQTAQILLQRDPPDLTELRAIIDDIVREDQRAADSIRRLRALFQQGKSTREMTDLPELARDLLRLMHRDLERRGVKVRVETPDDLPEVAVDPVQIRQVLLNLLLNACDVIDGLDPSRSGIDIAFAFGDGHLRFSVADRGPGLAGETAGRVFDPFFSTKESGLGVGLAVSRTIVAAHRGRIWMEHREGGGAVFCCELPLEPATTPS